MRFKVIHGNIYLTRSQRKEEINEVFYIIIRQKRRLKKAAVQVIDRLF